MSLFLKHPASTVVYKSGSDYIAEDYQGRLLATSDTDASVAINAAIEGIPDTGSWGGTIFIYRGDYDCKTTVTADVSSLAYNGIHLVGEGAATRLNFTPSGSLTNGILLKVSDPRLAHMRIYGNSNVTNLVQAVGVGGNPRHDYGIVEGITFDGANSVDGIDDHYTALPTAGQKGLFMNGANASRSTFFWKIHDCDFRVLDIGLHAFDQFSTSTSQNNNTFFNCETGVKISSGLHNINNCWFQGATDVGLYGIHLLTEGTGTANIININNIQAELPKTGGAITAAVYINGPSNIRLTNVFLSGSVLGRAIIDENLTRGNYDFERSFFALPSTNWRNVGWFLGHHPPDTGEGIMAGRLDDFGPTINSANALSGVHRAFITGSSSTIMGTIYTSGHIIMAANPDFRTRIFTSFTSNMRIFIGFIDVYSGASIVSTTDMLNTPRMGAGLWIDTGVSSNWKVMSNSGSGASTVADLSTPTAIENTATHNIRIQTVNSANKFTVYYDNVVTDITSDIPGSSDDIGWLISLENITTGSRTMLVYYGELRCER